MHSRSGYMRRIVYVRIVSVRLPSQKAPRAKHCWLSHGSPAITALSDEEEDGTMVEIEDDECCDEHEDSRIQRIGSSMAKLSNPVPTARCSPSPTRLSSPASTQPGSPASTRPSSPASIRPSFPAATRPSFPPTTWPSSPSPARLSLGDISNVLARRHEEEKSHLQKQIDDLQRRIAEYERGGHSAYMAPQHQPYQVQGPPHPMSWAMSSPPYGTFFPSPFGFYPHCMAIHSRHPGQQCQALS